MAYEIINSSPDYCFIPFGTGILYENILNISRKEVSSLKHDPRFKGNVKTLRNCNFIGYIPKAKTDQLYSQQITNYFKLLHYSAFFHKTDLSGLYSPNLTQWIRLYRSEGFCGKKSDVHLLKESYLSKAMKLAEKQGITCNSVGIAGLALMLQLKNSLPKNKKYLVVNTGNSMPK
ncbi:MAG: hypothetical protein ABH821_06150 [archaeon]